MAWATTPVTSSTASSSTNLSARSSSQGWWLPSTWISIPSWGMRFLRNRCCWERRLLGLPMPALTRMRRTVGRLRSIPSRSLSNSVKWLWLAPE